MDEILGLIGGVALAVVIAIVIMYAQKRKRGQAWKAVVTGISRIRGGEHEHSGQDQVKIKYRRDDGRKGTLKIDEYGFGAKYPGLKPGDRIIKEAGEDLPRVETPGASP